MQDPEKPLARRTPLLEVHREGEGLMSPYGNAADADSAALLVEAFDPVQIEYAAVRGHAAIFDQPHRATLEVAGPDRIEFLNRMVTQELKGWGTYETRRSFWLNRKGRIDADLRLVNLPDRVLIDVDVHAAERALKGLGGFIISEDCTVQDRTEQWHRVSVHGPGAAALLARLSEPMAGAKIAEIHPGQVAIVRIAGAEIIADRQDTAGEIGLEMLMPTAAAASVYETLSTSWSARESGGRMITPKTDLARRIGWHALNMARIEAGTALYLADFGPDSLPHETGSQTLNNRVSFKKGCYLGQEVVARMQSLGHPKQRLVGLRIGTAGDGPMRLGEQSAPLAHARGTSVAELAQAVTGTPVVGADEPGAAAVGAVTSSCCAPMLGQAQVAFAMVKWSHAMEGTKLWVQLGESRAVATVQESLKFWSR
jgi:tRNA-modifying protein YgfZ